VVFVLTNSTSDRRFFLTNPDRLFVAYDGLVLAEKRLSSAGRRRVARIWRVSR
jgi:hypothetical protein